MADEELLPTNTTGYKVGAKKTAAELAQLDAQDESLRKWKESLGLGAAGAASNDPRNVVVLALAMEVVGREDVILDLSTPDALGRLKDQSICIKEGIEYRLKVKFRINHDVVSGLKYIQIVKRGGIRVDRMEEMLGSYGPNTAPYEKKFMVEEAPSGMLARGHYNVKSGFVDDDGHTHLEWNWAFDIKKDWE
ncbi:immunoglobulin E-set [Polychytrium aggregatum]|uniref:immunoglobulin E-set n=1 Tax=Polychytrium aggregatum TaxID=110093 RepID=UPI0022FEF5DE|nr:immunoglobulin E-set [Polychytrium aggregatum]KAI9202498.1 immunoglobulin E-set [Polychytrium aggregatum]